MAKKKKAAATKSVKVGSRVKLHHTDGEHLHAVVDHVQDDGLIEVTIDHKGHEKHGLKTVVRPDGLVADTDKKTKKAPKAKKLKAKKSRAAAEESDSDIESGSEEENEEKSAEEETGDEITD